MLRDGGVAPILEQLASGTVGAFMQTDFKVFLSAVSSEFKSARDLVASDLRALKYEVLVQEDFDQEDGPNLRKLHDFVREADVVVAVMDAAQVAFRPDGCG